MSAADCSCLRESYLGRRLGGKLLLARECEEMLDELLAALYGLSDIVQQPQEAAVVRLPLQHFERADDCREQIVEVVHDTGHELTDRLHFLGLMQFLGEPSLFVFGLLLGGNILEAVHGANELSIFAKQGRNVDEDGNSRGIGPLDYNFHVPDGYPCSKNPLHGCFAMWQKGTIQMV